MNWDDLRIAIAVHQTGSYAAAAAKLRVDETTVARRLARLRNDIGFPIFEATGGSRQPTARGIEMLRQARLMAGCVEKIEAVERDAKTPVATYRIAATDSIAVGVLAPGVPEMLARYPGLTLHLMASTENVNFSRWETDLAIRLREPEKGDFIISKIADLDFYFVEPNEHTPGSGVDLLCAYPEDLDHSPESRYLTDTGLKLTARLISKNLLVARSLISSGQFSGVLPGFMCADMLDNPSFVATRLPEPRGVWLLQQSHLKGDPTIRMLIDWIKESFTRANSPAGPRSQQRNVS